MSAYRPYPKYKYSGVEWLGDVPEKWEVVQLKQFVNIQNGSDHKHVEEAEGYPVMGSGGIFAYASDFLYDGESVLLGRKGTIDKPLHVTGRFWTVDTMYWTKISPRASGRFIYYSALTIPFDYYSTNTALPSMTKGNLSSHLVARPSLPEQLQIATFLDRECGKLDALQAKQELLIELLKEKRQALISHAVTKGLDPTAKLKPSGIEWLGDVPEGWRVTRLKHLVSNKNYAGIQTGPFGGMLTDLLYQEDGEFKVFGQENVLSGDFEKGGRWLSEPQFKALSNYVANPGDLLFTRKGSIGGCCIFPSSCRPGIIDSDTIRISLNPVEIISEFLLWAFKFAHYQETQVQTLKRGAILSGLNTEVLSNLIVLAPPLADQRAIVAHLDEKCGKIDQLKAKAERAIALLKERRSALISAAVTGKMDVRGPAN